MFQPWVTSDFGQKDNYINGLRLMVLGESHHEDNPSVSSVNKNEFTSGVIGHLAINGSYRFFTNIIQTVVGVKKYNISSRDVERFWRSVIFYNYVPEMVDSRPKHEGGLGRCPTRQMFLDGREPLQTVLQTYQPEIVLVCGNRLWGYLLPGLPEFSGDAWRYFYFDDGKRVFGRIHHPSIGFSSVRWHSNYRQLSRFVAVPRAVQAFTRSDPGLP